MESFGKTDKGKVRTNNEDNYYISSINDDYKLFIIADGMGGCKAGEIASEAAIETVKNYIEDNFLSISHDYEDLQNFIKNAIVYANMIIFEKSSQNIEMHGMGTTIDVVFIYNNKVYIGHIGDSRVYRIRRNKIKKITKDHSYVQELIIDGTITEEESMYHPQKNKLTKALGAEEHIEPDIYMKNLVKNDIIFMCTDGITNMILEEDVLEIIKANENNLENSANDLIKVSNTLGGKDNMTVILFKNN